VYFRIVVLLLSAAALGGCGLVPPAVSLASMAADAFSYAVSGKSVSDHGLSMVMKEDCAVLNFLHGEAVCAPGAHPQIQMVTPRDSELQRTVVASAHAPAAAATDRKGPGWTAPELLPVQFAVAGPLLDRSVLPVAALIEPRASGPFDILRLEPLASGPVDILASTPIGEPPV
jgi:hypothetical protein